MFSVVACPRKPEKQSLQIPHILICYALLHSHETATRQEFHIQIVLSVNGLFSFLLERFSKPSGIKSGTIRRWMGEYGKINRKFSNFPDFCQDYCITHSPQQPLQTAGANPWSQFLPKTMCDLKHGTSLILPSGPTSLKRSLRDLSHGFENYKPKGLVDE